MQSALPKTYAVQDHDGQNYATQQAHQRKNVSPHIQKVSDKNFNAFEMTPEIQEDSGSTSSTSCITEISFQDEIVPKINSVKAIQLTSPSPDTYFDDPDNFQHFWYFLDHVWVAYIQYYEITGTSIERETLTLVDNMKNKGIKIRMYQQGIPAELGNTPQALTWAACKLLGVRGPVMKDVIKPAKSIIANVHKLARMVEKLSLREHRSN